MRHRAHRQSEGVGGLGEHAARALPRARRFGRRLRSRRSGRRGDRWTVGQSTRGGLLHGGRWVDSGPHRTPPADRTRPSIRALTPVARGADTPRVKLIVAIVHNEDAGVLVDALLEGEFRATRLHSSGGFLKQSNATILVGVEDADVEEVMASSGRTARRGRRSSTRCRRSWSRASSSCPIRSRSRSAGRPSSWSRSSGSSGSDPRDGDPGPRVSPLRPDLVDCWIFRVGR